MEGRNHAVMKALFWCDQAKQYPRQRLHMGFNPFLDQVPAMEFLVARKLAEAEGPRARDVRADTEMDSVGVPIEALPPDSWRCHDELVEIAAAEAAAAGGGRRGGRRGGRGGGRGGCRGRAGVSDAAPIAVAAAGGDDVPAVADAAPAIAAAGDVVAGADAAAIAGALPEGSSSSSSSTSGSSSSSR